MALGGSYPLSSDHNVQVPLGTAAKSCCQHPVTHKCIELIVSFLPVISAYAVTGQVMSQPCFCCDIH